MKNKILEVKNLRKTYHDSNGEIEAIKNINFDIYEEAIKDEIEESNADYLG